MLFRYISEFRIFLNSQIPQNVMYDTVMSNSWNHVLAFVNTHTHAHQVSPWAPIPAVCSNMLVLIKKEGT